MLHSCFTSIRLHRGLSPPGCWTCPAHNAGLRPPPSAAVGVDRGPPDSRLHLIDKWPGVAGHMRQISCQLFCHRRLCADYAAIDRGSNAGITSRAIRVLDANRPGKTWCSAPQPHHTTLRAIRYRAVLRGWAFRPILPASRALPSRPFLAGFDRPSRQDRAPDLPPVAGEHACIARDHEYKRLGTLRLLAGIHALE